MATPAVCVKTRESSPCYDLPTMLIRRLVLELAVVLAIAAMAAIGLSRVLFAPTLDAVTARAANARISRLEFIAMTDSGMGASDPQLTGTEPELRESALAPTPRVRNARGASADSTAVAPGVPTQRGPLTLDLRGVRDPTSLVPGAVMTPNDSPEGGYVVRANDRAGFLTSAGVRPGDVLIAVNGRPTLSADQLLAAYVIIRSAPALSLRFRRGSSQFEVAANVLR